MKRLLPLICAASFFTACDEVPDSGESQAGTPRRPALHGKRPIGGKVLPGTIPRGVNDPDPVD